jgi:hypothetical protein
MNLPADASDDQSNCPPDYYRRKNGMLHQIPVIDAVAASNAPDLSRLGDMSREELITLIKMVSGAIWGYALLDDTQKVEAARLKLYNLGMTSTEVHKVVPALDKWFDRSLGKAPQSIAMTVENKGLSALSDERLLNLERELSRVTGNDAIVISPMPEKLTD